MQQQPYSDVAMTYDPTVILLNDLPYNAVIKTYGMEQPTVIKSNITSFNLKWGICKVH